MDFIRLNWEQHMFLWVSVFIQKNNVNYEYLDGTECRADTVLSTAYTQRTAGIIFSLQVRKPSYRDTALMCQPG